MLLLRHMEDYIRDLCQLLSAETDDEKARLLTVELREELHEYIEQTRAKMVIFSPAGPVVTEMPRSRKKSAEGTVDSESPAA